MSILANSFWMNNEGESNGLNPQDSRRKSYLPGNVSRQNKVSCTFYFFLKAMKILRFESRKHAQADVETKLLSATIWAHSCLHCWRSWMAAEEKWRTYEFFFYFIQLAQKIADYLFPLKVHKNMIWHPPGCYHNCQSCFRELITFTPIQKLLFSQAAIGMAMVK